jgi:predicted regulator of Ras-like GTPase activity (Roadblock/LC7/MglB family)
MKVDPVASLGPDDILRINELLRAFLKQASARCALLLDRAGRSITAVGDTRGLDETSFASLAAADFEASDRLAGLLGEREFNALYHQGVHGSMYLSDLAGIAILAAVFDRRTTLGMVRVGTREVVPRLVALLGDPERRVPRQDALDSDWRDDAAGEIDRLFAG